MGFIKTFIKKYAALLPSIGLLVFAVILLLPTLWLGGKVRAQMDTSVRQAQTIQGLSANVPSRNTPALVTAYMDRLENEATLIDDLVRQSSQRELIAWNIFPQPQDTSSQVYLEYGRNYNRAIETMLQTLNALDAPSETEIRRHTGTTTTRPVVGGGITDRTATTRRPGTLDPMVDALCVARAESISVYASPAAFAWYAFWNNYTFEGRTTALQDCWNSQIALWIYDDIAKTIQAMNTGSSRVATSPVKRLLGVSFSGPVAAGESQRPAVRVMGDTATRRDTGRDNPNYVTATLPSVFVLPLPWTGRIGGTDYDVVHFAVSVIIDNRHVLSFMQELCSEKEHTSREDFQEDGRVIASRHNQITILESAVSAVEKDNPTHELYRYGDGAVMRLDLVGEYLLNRKGYDAIKPDPIKESLGQLETQPGTPGAGGSNW